MNDDPFHLMAISEQQYHMAYNDALLLQCDTKNGVAIKEAWDVVRDREYKYKSAFDNYIQYLLEMEAEFI